MSAEIVHDGGDWTVERYAQPIGAEVFCKDGEGLAPQQAHSYWTEHKGNGSCSGRIPGISTVAKNDGDTNTDNLCDWAAKLSCEGVARELALALSLEDADDIRSALSWCGSGDEIWQTLQAEKLTWKEIRREKGRVGSVSHGVLEGLAAGASPILRTGYDNAVADWWAKNAPVPELMEQVVYSPSCGFAGRFDLRAEIDGQKVLLDLKTSGFISNAFHIQLAGYDLACGHAGFGHADHAMVLQVREDGTWTEWPGHGEHEDFIAALEIYKRGKRIGSQARKDWREWKQAQEAA